MAKRYKIYPICWTGAICSLSGTCFHILFQYLLLSTGGGNTFSHGGTLLTVWELSGQSGVVVVDALQLRLWRALWRERDSFIPPGRNVIISITDETLPQEAFYAFVFPFILWPDNSTAPYSLYFFSFILLILPLLPDFDCCLRCCYIWNWLEGALSDFVTLFSDGSFSAPARQLILN